MTADLSMLEWHALLDALRFLNYHKDYGRVVEVQRGEIPTYRMTLALAHSFMVVSLVPGGTRNLPFLGTKDEPAYRWFSHLPWSAARCDSERRVLQFACPRFHGVSQVRGESGVDSSPFCLDVPLHHYLLDWLMDFPTLATGLVTQRTTDNDVTPIPGAYSVPLVSHLSYPEFESAYLGVAA